MDKLLLRPIETAQLIGLGRSKTYQLIASGEIPSVRIGRSVRVPADGLRDWIEQKRREAEQDTGDLRPDPA